MQCPTTNHKPQTSAANYNCLHRHKSPLAAQPQTKMCSRPLGSQFPSRSCTMCLRAKSTGSLARFRDFRGPHTSTHPMCAFVCVFRPPHFFVSCQQICRFVERNHRVFVRQMCLERLSLSSRIRRSLALPNNLLPFLSLHVSKNRFTIRGNRGYSADIRQFCIHFA